MLQVNLKTNKLQFTFKEVLLTIEEAIIRALLTLDLRLNINCGDKFGSDKQTAHFIYKYWERYHHDSVDGIELIRLQIGQPRQTHRHYLETACQTLQAGTHLRANKAGLELNWNLCTPRLRDCWDFVLSSECPEWHREVMSRDHGHVTLRRGLSWSGPSVMYLLFQIQLQIYSDPALVMPRIIITHHIRVQMVLWQTLLSE